MKRTLRIFLTMIVALHLFSSCDENKELGSTDNNGLVAYYPFNGNATDESGNGFNGTLLNGVALVNDRNDEIGKAYTFDGVDSYIETSAEIDNDLGAGATFSAWIYIRDKRNPFSILSNYNGPAMGGACNGRIGFHFNVNDVDGLYLLYAVDGNDLVGRSAAGTDLDLNTWYHVVGTWDGTLNDDSGFKLYINGARKDDSDLSIGNIPCGYLESPKPFLIGRGLGAGGFGKASDGHIDEARIYSRVLSESEISMLAAD